MISARQARKYPRGSYNIDKVLQSLEDSIKEAASMGLTEIIFPLTINTSKIQIRIRKILEGLGYLVVFKRDPQRNFDYYKISWGKSYD